jgi:K+-transporting ATPase KdpF subunit
MMPRQGGRKDGHARHDFYHFDGDIFWIVRILRENLRWIEVGKMLDTIVSLAVCGALLVYLVYAMLRPEKF